ncbi:hypothetical protein DFH05DRAFT_1487547 [Lentinula detonsa]|uniref:DRBM domain-containing protein n=1 Tax=Lentinula detonsa TaxID=2804962 RepID=A0A9W8P2E2_9AGAR|nr:hypothetical protein DFH05DRAFT_1487547 [Lentinula detonsa]
MVESVNKLNNESQRRHWKVYYQNTHEGPLHAGQWHSVVYINDINYGSGTDRTEKGAKELAAATALEVIESANNLK